MSRILDTSSKDKNKDDRWVPGMKPERIKALTDGVFAIAMTLLVLELSVPYFIGDGGAGGHPTSFAEIWGEFYVYIICFLTLGVYWIIHDYIFQFIRRADGIISWMNMVFLMFAAMVPFSSEMLNLNEQIPFKGEESNFAGAFFLANTVITIMILFFIWTYATGKKRLVDKDIDMNAITTLKRIMVTGPGIAVFGMLLSLVIPDCGYLSLVALLFMMITTAYGRFFPGYGKKLRAEI